MLAECDVKRVFKPLLLAQSGEKKSSNEQIIRDNPYITFKSDELLEYSWSIIIIATVKCTRVHQAYPHTNIYSLIHIQLHSMFELIFLSFFVLHLYFISFIPFSFSSSLFYFTLFFTLHWIYLLIFLHLVLFPLQINNFIDIFITFMHTLTHVRSWLYRNFYHFIFMSERERERE